MSKYLIAISLTILKIILIIAVLKCNIVLSKSFRRSSSALESESSEETSPSSSEETNYFGHRINKVSKHVFEKKCIVPKFVMNSENFFNANKDQYDIYNIELFFKLISMQMRFKYGDELEKRLRRSDPFDNMYLQLRRINECIQINF